MRLIDADKIIFHEIDEIGGEYAPYLGCSKEHIDNQPTVKASPLDKVEQIRAEIANMDIYHYEDKDGYLVERRVDYDDVLTIIDKYLEG